MKILIYSFPLISYTTFIMETDIILRHLDKNDDIHFLYFQKNNFQKYVPTDDGLNRFVIPNENIHYINEDLNDINIPEFGSLDELKNFKINDIDIGSSVLSSLISTLKDPKPDLYKHRDIYRELIFAAIRVYRGTLNCLKELKPDLFYLYNGRFNVYRPALRAAQKLSINTLAYEVSKEANRYFFIENNYVHDLESVKKEILKNWEIYQTPEIRAKIAKEYFTEKRNGLDLSSFTKGQDKSALPKNFNKAKTNIVIFNSSEDELEAIESWKKTFVKSQIEAIKTILKNFPDKNIHFYLRVHPNIKNKEGSQLKEILELSYPNLTIIHPDSKIDTYKLMEECEKVIVFGSTIGVEACFWNKPVILIGRAFYEDLNVCYIPKSYKEALILIRKNLKILPQENSYKYGYYEKTKGIKLSKYKHELASSQAYFYFYYADLSFMYHSAPKDSIIKEYNKAYNLYTQYSDITNSSVFLSLLYTMCKRSVTFEKYNESIKYAKEILSNYPNMTDILILLAQSYAFVGEFFKAIITYHNILEIYNKEIGSGISQIYHENKAFFTNIYLEMGRCYILINDNINGLKYLKEAEKISNENLVYIYLLKYYAINDDMNSAIDYYLKCNQNINNDEKRVLYINANLPNYSNEYRNMQSDLLFYISKLQIWFKEEIEEIISKRKCLVSN